MKGAAAMTPRKLATAAMGNRLRVNPAPETTTLAVARKGLSMKGIICSRDISKVVVRSEDKY